MLGTLRPLQAVTLDSVVVICLICKPPIYIYIYIPKAVKDIYPVLLELQETTDYPDLTLYLDPYSHKDQNGFFSSRSQDTTGSLDFVNCRCLDSRFFILRVCSIDK